MKNIYVGNVSFSATEDMLRSLFEEYGTVEWVNVVTDRDTGQPRGFGFVEMSNDAEAAKAISALNGTDFEGRTLSLNEARPKTDRPREDRPGGGGGQMKSIYVGDLSFSATEDMLRSLFEKYGPVEAVKIVTDSESGRRRNFGFVEMSNDAEAVKAINALNGTDFEGRTLTVNEARTREDRPRTDRPGCGGGQMKSIYVGNLSSSVTEDVLRALFEAYGGVERVGIVTDRDTGQPRGFAFVDMTNDAGAVKAIAALNGRDLEGGRLNVNEARPRTGRPGGGGGGYGRKRR